MEVVTFLNKWVHLISVIGTVGGIFVMRFAVLPALGDAAESDAGRAVSRRFGILLAVTWLAVLITGFVNYAIVSPHVSKGYHMILGMKIALALVMFAISVALSHPAPSFARFQRNQSSWLLLLSLFAVVVIGLSAHLNISRITGSGLDRNAPAAGASP